MAIKKIYVGVGHGGSDPGAGAYGYRESDLNLQVAFKCQAALQRCGFDTKISRSSDVDFNTAAKVVDANRWGADYVFDVHHNAGGGEGWEIYRANAGGESQEFANAISSYITELGRKNRGVKTRLYGSTDYFGIIRETNAPANLIEYGFIDNEKDVQYITDERNQKNMAECTARGICDVFGVPYVSAGTIANIKVQLGAFIEEGNARAYMEKLREMGLDAFLITSTTDNLYRIQVGAFQDEGNANAYCEHIKSLGLPAFIVK